MTRSVIYSCTPGDDVLSGTHASAVTQYRSISLHISVRAEALRCSLPKLLALKTISFGVLPGNPLHRILREYRLLLSLKQPILNDNDSQHRQLRPIAFELAFRFEGGPSVVFRDLHALGRTA